MENFLFCFNSSLRCLFASYVYTQKTVFLSPFHDSVSKSEIFTLTSKTQSNFLAAVNSVSFSWHDWSSDTMDLSRSNVADQVMREPASTSDREISAVIRSEFAPPSVAEIVLGILEIDKFGNKTGVRCWLWDV